MDFPIAESMDEQACYDKLVGWLHPAGLACPRCHGRGTFYTHRRDRAPILDYRCRECRCVFNAFTATALRGTKRRPVPLLLILRGFAQGASTARLARELECDRLESLKFRHKLQDLASRSRDLDPLEDDAVEADEMYQNAGEKRRAAPRPVRSAAAPREQASRPRDVRQRPAAGLRRRGPRQRQGQAVGRGELGQADAGASGTSGDRADGAREDGRVAGVQRAARDAPPAIGGVPRRGRVGPRR
jgi:transposase-like protein